MNLLVLLALFGCPKDPDPTKNRSTSGPAPSGLDCDSKIIDVDIGTTEIRNVESDTNAVGLVYARCTKAEGYAEGGCLIRSSTSGSAMSDVHPHPDADGSQATPNSLFLEGVRASWMGCTAKSCTWQDVQAKCQEWADVPGQDVVGFQLAPWNADSTSLKKMRVSPAGKSPFPFWYGTASGLDPHPMAWCLGPGTVGSTSVMPPTVDVTLSELSGTQPATSLVCGAGREPVTAKMTYSVIAPSSGALPDPGQAGAGPEEAGSERVLEASDLTCTEEGVIDADIGTTEILNSVGAESVSGLLYSECRIEPGNTIGVFAEGGCIIRRGSRSPSAGVVGLDALERVHPNLDNHGEPSEAIHLRRAAASTIPCAEDQQCSWEDVQDWCQDSAEALGSGEVLSFWLDSWDEPGAVELRKVIVDPQPEGLESFPLWHDTREEVDSRHVAWCLGEHKAGNTGRMPISVAVNFTATAETHEWPSTPGTCPEGQSWTYGTIRYEVIEP